MMNLIRDLTGPWPHIRTNASRIQIITEAYQAGPASTLKAETHVPPLNLYLDFMVARATQCLEYSEMTAKIKRACQEIHCYLQTTWPESMELLH